MSRKRFEPAYLTESPFKRKEMEGEERRCILHAFSGEGLICEVLEQINTGKEATVYRCRSGPGIKEPYVIAKVYRARKFRAFRNEMRYLELQSIRDTRASRALHARSVRGRAASLSFWVQREWEILNLLWRNGAIVPRPWACSEQMILMEYCENNNRPAARLIDTILSPGEEAQSWFDLLIQEIELFLTLNIVHSDLSPYNVLALPHSPLIIDFPQAVDARFCSEAPLLLCRDIENICAYFAKLDVISDATAIADELWGTWSRGGGHPSESPVGPDQTSKPNIRRRFR